MTTLGTVLTGRANGKTATQPLDLGHVLTNVGLAVARHNMTASIAGPGHSPGPAIDLGTPQAILASVTAWTEQDDDAHEPCSLTACRNPLHPGPCKGWKGTLHSVSPGTYHQIEAERVRKANSRRVKRIADLKAQGKPIPRRLLEEIKPKPAPTHPAHNATAVPLGQVNQKADLAGGQAHHAGAAVSKAAGVTVKTAPLPLGPKAKKPTVAGRGPAFVITQPKVTDQYKLDKAAKITPQEWNALTDADKTTIRNELVAIKARGFGPQQRKSDELLAKLPAPGGVGTLAPGTPGTVTTPSGHTYQKVSVAPGKVSLGQASKTATPPAPAAPSAPAAAGAKHVHTVTLNGKEITRTSTRNYTHASVVQKGHGGEKVVWGFHGSEQAARSTPLTSMQRKNGFHVVDVLPVKREPLKKDSGRAPTPLVTPSPPPPAPSTPSVLSPDAQQARAVAGRGIGRPTSKAHLDAYGKLTKADFDSLDDRTQRTIRDDLANAKAKFLDPKKQQEAQHLLDRFGSRHTSPAPGAPAVPAHPKGYSDPVAQAVAAAHGTDDAVVLQRVGQISHTQLGTLDAADKKTITARLAFIASHPKGDPATKEKAQQLGRLIVTGKPAGLPKLDHEPTLNEIHAHQASTGFHAQTKALEAAADTAMPRADRVTALDGLSKAHFDDLNPQQQRRITDALQDVHDENSGYGKAHDASSTMAGEAITKYTGHHPAIARALQAETDFRAGKIDGRGLHTQILSARVQAGVGTIGNRLRVAEQKIAEDNPTLPLWTRASLVENPYSGVRGNPYSVIGQLSMEHSWKPAPRLSQSDFQYLFQSSDDDLKNTHPIHVEAIKKYREHVVHTGLESGSPWSTATKGQLVDSLTGTGVGGSGYVVTDARMKMIDALPAGDRMLVRTVLSDRILAQTNNRARAGTDITLRQLQGHPYTGDRLDAALASTNHFPSASTQDIYRKLDPQDFQSLSYYAQKAIGEQLDELQTRAERGGPVLTYDAQSNPLKVFPKALKDHLNGDRADYADRRLRMASDVANYGQKIVNPYDRTRAYAGVPIGQFRNMSQTDQAMVNNDLYAIAADAGNPLPIRYGALFTNDFTHGLAHNKINSPQLVAIGATDPRPGNQQPDSNVFPALDNLTKADYDSLDKVYRESIDERINGLSGSDQQLLNAKFHPTAAAATPSGYTPTTAQANVQPHVQDALDTIYGVHPKSHTMAHQLSTYGALRGSDFYQLNAQEQNHLLSDLSFIETTAKGPSATKAKLLIDRFTPAGTPSGQVPTPAVIPPANSVPGQVRYATPLKGTLIQAKDKGTGGDGWTTTPGGKRVWGKYGAAGLLLMHQDPATGERRYLMVQRGPGISDPGKWQFPGGAIDSKETFHQGGTREVIEELGFKDDALKDAEVHGEHTNAIPGSSWKYVSVAAQVPQMLKPDLSTHHARMETSDAKWMTEAEIKALDTGGKLLAPLAGGKLEQNVLSLFPQGTASGTTLGQIVRPGPVGKRLKRLTLPSGGRQAPAQFNAWPHAHKPSKGTSLVRDKAAIDKLRQDVKHARTQYDGKTGDGRLAAIGAMQGYDDTPTVVDKKEMDRLLATGDYIEAWRGVKGSYGSHGVKSSADINDDFRSGPAWYGRGIFGNGYYLATQKSVASKYSDGRKNSLVRILIPKSAITEQYKDVQTQARANSSRTTKAKGGRYEDGTLYDPGRWAAAKGVDGIEIRHDTINDTGGWARHVAAPGKPAFNWLNRSVLIVQEADK